MISKCPQKLNDEGVKLITNLNILIVYSQIKPQDSGISESNINARLFNAIECLIEKGEFQVENLEFDTCLPSVNTLTVDS